MKTISLKKIERPALIVLQGELDSYQKVIAVKEEFFTAIALLDITFRLWVALRSKIENGKEIMNLKFKPQEAAVIVKCCLNSKQVDPYAMNVMEQIKTSLDQQLKSL